MVITKRPKIQRNVHYPKGAINPKLQIILEEHKHSDLSNLVKQDALPILQKLIA